MERECVSEHDNAQQLLQGDIVLHEGERSADAEEGDGENHSRHRGKGKLYEKIGSHLLIDSLLQSRFDFILVVAVCFEPRLVNASTLKLEHLRQ